MSNAREQHAPYNLARFLTAQESSYAQAVAELRRGRKQSHWIWYIFPQLKGLGSSETSRLFGIASLTEARAYLADPVLGPRLHECTQLALEIPDKAVGDIFPYPDDLKFGSSMTLFAAAAAESAAPSLFTQATERFFQGKTDPRTLELLREV
jgi:uncharacterized protein (DUF1810 family)